MSTRDTASLASTPEGPKQPNKSTDDNRLGKAEVAKDTEALTRFLSRFDSTNPLTASDNFKIPEFCLGRNATKTVRTCRLSTCDQLIAKRDYVVRVFPPVDPKLKYPEAWNYHVRCFELAADVRDKRFFDHITLIVRDAGYLTPTMRGKIRIREQAANCLDPGALRIAVAWMMQRLLSLDKNTFAEEKHNGWTRVFWLGGSRELNLETIRDDVKCSRMAKNLAPYESDGPQDNDEWYFHSEYPGAELAEELERWRMDKYIATHPKLPDNSNEMIHRKATLSPKALRCMARLANEKDEIAGGSAT